MTQSLLDEIDFVRASIQDGTLRGKSLGDFLLKAKYNCHYMTYTYMSKLFCLGEKDKNYRYNDATFPIDSNRYAPTLINYTIKLADKLNLTSKDVVYDLGSGRGIFINLLGLLCCSDAKIKGIELTKPYVKESRNISKMFALSNVETIHGNVLDVDFSDGTVFYMFNPFGWRTTNKIMEKIKVLSRKRIVRIVAFCNGFHVEKCKEFDESIKDFPNRNWVEKYDEIYESLPMCLFKTNRRGRGKGING